jgi:dTDP-4-dehydrorhamnose reductase
MNILLIGANGQVGFELARQLPSTGLLTTTRSGVTAVEGRECIALDVTDLAAIGELIGERRPDVVINASAYTAVDRAESEPALAFRVNAEAPRRMAEASRAAGARLVHYSTDYVFDGTAREPYRTGHPAAPLGVYGASKRAGEEAILATGADALILRTAWVYATRGRNFLLTMLRLASEREEVRVVDDQVGSPTPAWFIAEVTRALLRSDAGGIRHVVTRGQTSWFGFAGAIFAAAVERGLLERAPRLVPIPSSAYPTPAARPGYSVLDCEALEAAGVAVPEWHAALLRTLDAMQAAHRCDSL